MTTRRDFLRASAVATGAVGLGVGSVAGTPGLFHAQPGDLARTGIRRGAPLKILILGGTSFLGPHQIRYALERGHEVSIFSRGQTEPSLHRDLFHQVEHLVGDRADNLDALRGRSWDAVIDNSGRAVEWTRDTAQLLKDSVETYMYTSSTGVYLPYLGNDLREDRDVLLEDPPEIPEAQRPTYGVMKSLSEIEVRRAFGEHRTIVVRPTYILGAADQTTRSAYWPVRIEQGGEVLVPGKSDDPVQYIDVRDLTEWMIRLLENKTAGTFNAAGPASPLGMHAFIHGVHAATSSDVTWVMADDYEFLRENQVRFVIPWIMPVDDYEGSAHINMERAVASGLTYRPLADTFRAILDWWHSDAVSEERRTGLLEGPRSMFTLEKGVIAAWRATQ